MFLERSTTPIDRELNKRVVKIIHGLLNMEESAAFRKPVAHKALGLDDYKLIVKKPTDLNLIRRQNLEGKYKFVEEVLDDIQLCWDNCKLYNAIGSQIYNQALFMQEAFDKLGIEVLPDFWNGVDRSQYNMKFTEKKIEEEKKKPQIKHSISKYQTPQIHPEESSKMRMKKKVTFRSGNIQSSSLHHSQPVEHISYEKEKSENHEHDQIDSHPQEMGPSEKVSMDVEEGDEIVVEPIIVNLYQSPTREQLLQLSEQVKNLYAKEDFALLEKVVDILHSNEKENMSLSKNGQMNFKMSKIHISTYERLRKILGMSEEPVSLIE